MFEDVLALTNVFGGIENGRLLFHTLVKFTVSSMDAEDKRRARRGKDKEEKRMVLFGNHTDEQAVRMPAVDSPVSDEPKVIFAIAAAWSHRSLIAL